MKKLLYLLPFLFALSANAQEIKLDTPSNTAYAEIQSIPISWLRGAPNVNRLYVSNPVFNFDNKASVNWWLKYPIIIDSNTKKYESITNGSVSVNIDASGTIDDAWSYIFNYIADSLILDISYK
jgi:hypothetical protein